MATLHYLKETTMEKIDDVFPSLFFTHKISYYLFKLRGEGGGQWQVTSQSWR